jgi:S1-C subfamily serine protease
VGGSPSFDWLGTGFLVAPDVVLTNRHVAVEFARAQGAGWSFRSGMSAGVDFNAELGAEAPLEFAVREIVGIHEDHDLAVLRVEQTAGDETLPEPLAVAAETPATLQGRQVYVIGYPAWDGRRNDPEPMLRIFSNIFNVKRLQPGEISGEAVDAGEIFHDCSTLGGNSGSPVIDLETHRVIGLHFGGRYLERNHAVPLWTLRDDPLVRAARLNFQ